MLKFTHVHVCKLSFCNTKFGTLTWVWSLNSTCGYFHLLPQSNYPAWPSLASHHLCRKKRGPEQIHFILFFSQCPPSPPPTPPHDRHWAVDILINREFRNPAQPWSSTLHRGRIQDYTLEWQIPKDSLESFCSRCLSGLQLIWGSHVLEWIPGLSVATSEGAL